MSLPDITNEDLHKIVSKALKGVFKTMLKLECEEKRCIDYSGLRAKAPDLGGEELNLVYVGSVGFVGNVTGIVYLYMKADFTYEAAQIITGLPQDEVDDEIICDVCGELSNMFAGSFKNTLADLGYQSTLTIPTVLSGDELYISTLGVVKHLRFDYTAHGQEVVADLILAEPVAC